MKREIEQKENFEKKRVKQKFMRMVIIENQIWMMEMGALFANVSTKHTYKY